MLQRFLTPRWVAGHLIVITLAAVFVRLGIWQLDRLDERRSFNDRIAERLSAAPTDLNLLLAEEPVDELEHRRTVLTGVFDVDEEVLIRSRTHNGEAGFHVVTPLETSQGQAVLINRGWVPQDLDDPPIEAARPPVGTVDVSGTIRSSQSAPALGPRDPDSGLLTRAYWIDIPRLQQQSSYELAPVSVDLDTQTPAQSGALPVPAPPRELTDGSHLAYAIQWFAFALIGLVGYFALLRHNRRSVGEGSQSAAGKAKSRTT